MEFVTEETLKEYEAFLQNHPKGHFMQSPQWGKLKSQWRWQGVISRGEDGNIKGVLSLLSRKLPILPWSFLYGARGPVCDPEDRETLADLMEGARTVAKAVRAYECKLDPDVLSSNRNFVGILEDLGFSLVPQGPNLEGIQPRYLFRLPIQGRNMEELLASFASKTRYNIRLAIKKNVEVMVAGRKALPDFARIMRETGERDGFTIRPQEYFEQILALLGEHARLYMVRYQQQYIAGAIAIYYGDKVWYLYGASSNEHRNVMPNYLMQYEMIRWAVESGASVYDFRGMSRTTDPEEIYSCGIYRFKKGFNADLCTLVGEMQWIPRPFVKRMIDLCCKVYYRLRQLFSPRKSAPLQKDTNQ